MTTQKFETEVNTLKKFFEYYCEHKHEEKTLFTKNINYKDNTFVYELNLCNECLQDINYSIVKLQNCVHEEKPRCRKCPSPCYEKHMWKKLAKVMRFSGIHFKLENLKKSFFS